jgi:hypothetical protein
MCSAKAKFVWHDKEQKAFEDIKAIISRETLLAYPNFLNDFHIYTDSSDYQLGAVIMQNDRPLAFYSRKLNSAQKRYTTGEQDLLSIVETLKEFKNILLGQKLIVQTDHKNLLYQMAVHIFISSTLCYRLLRAVDYCYWGSVLSSTTIRVPS